MKRVQTINEYLRIMNQFKKECKAPVTNIFWTTDLVNRYIALKRLFFKKQEKGGCFLCDESEYYRLLYYVNANEHFDVQPLNKSIAVRNIYKTDFKKREKEFEKQLEYTGFRKMYSAVEVYVPLEQGEKLKKLNHLYQSILKKGNFYISHLNEGDLSALLELRKETPEFHLYNFAYKSQEEYLEEIENQHYIGIYNKEKELCACIYIAQGMNCRMGDGICVKKEYKQKYGLGAILMCHVLNEAINVHKQKYVSWSEQQNSASITFHESMGFMNTGRFSNEWVLE